jgi:hypothetical protein
MLKFLRLCARWYNHSSLGRLLSSLKDPFELKYKDLLEEIEHSSGHVESLAVAGARVEVRSIHALTTVDHARLVELDVKVETTFNAQNRKLENMEKCISSISNSQVAAADRLAMLTDGPTRLLGRQWRLDPTDPAIMQILDDLSRISDEQARLGVMVTKIYKSVVPNQSVLHMTHRAVCRLEFHSILEFFTPKTPPSSALRKTKPLVQRRPNLANPRLENMLRKWGSSPQSSIPVLHAGLREQNQASELAADVVNHLRNNSQCVFWNISVGISGQKVTMEDVFKSIIYQALQQPGATFADLGEQLHPQKIHGSHTAREWAKLICLLFAKLPKVFIVLETRDLRNTYSDNHDWTVQLLVRLQMIVDRTTAAKGHVNVLLLLYCSKASTASGVPPKNSVCIATLQPQTVIPARLKNKAGLPGLNLRGWKLSRPTQQPGVR